MRIRRLQRRLVPLAAALTAIALTAAPAAHAEDVGHKLIRACAEGKSLSGYPPSAYAKALKEISATTEEYSECGQLIRAAQAGAASGHGGASSAGTVPTQAVPVTPAEQKSLAGAAAAGAGPIDLGGQEIHPGVVHANVASAFSTLPTPLLVLLAFLLAVMLAFAGRFLRNRIRDERVD
jgi:hypothetical protein